MLIGFPKKFVPITLDEDGLNCNELRTACEQFSPKIIYTVPNFQNPTGISYSIEKEKQLLIY